MDMKHGLDIHFHGITEEQFYSGDDSGVSVLSGTNNCGKTLILKQLFNKFGKKAYLCGANRYYSVEHFPVYSEQPQYIATTWNNIRTQIGDGRYNNDPVVMSFQDVFIRMTDEERRDVYRISSDCLGENVGLHFVNPKNSMSNSFLKIGTTPLAQCSSGSRMLVHLVSVLLSNRFDIVLIDEPELGLTPRIQNAIQELIFDANRGAFSHLQHIYIATHSHIFLNRRRLADNFLVQRDGNAVHVRRLSTCEEFRNLQFAQLGNSFEQLQLPSGFLIVEGTTDYQYLNRLLRLKFPDARMNVIAANGDGQVKKKVHDLLEVIGDLGTSPYSNRVLVILDKTHSPTLVSDLGRMGLPEGHVIEWTQNGIEYYYPESIMRAVFEDDSLTVADLGMPEDRISYSGIQKNKAELSKAVLDLMNGSEELDPELEDVLKRIESFG